MSQNHNEKEGEFYRFRYVVVIFMFISLSSQFNQGTVQFLKGEASSIPLGIMFFSYDPLR